MKWWLEKWATQLLWNTVTLTLFACILFNKIMLNRGYHWKSKKDKEQHLVGFTKANGHFILEPQRPFSTSPPTFTFLFPPFSAISTLFPNKPLWPLCLNVHAALSQQTQRQRKKHFKRKAWKKSKQTKMSNKAPIFPMPEPQHFSDYGFDPQIDYFQVSKDNFFFIWFYTNS